MIRTATPIERAAVLALAAALVLGGCAGAAPTATDAAFSVREVRPSKAKAEAPAAKAATAKASAAKAAAAATPVVATATLAITGAAGYRLQTLTAYNTTDIDHVTLTLYKNDGTGNYVATGVTLNVANANLATAVSLGNLRSNTTYRVIARAFADAAETTEIDDIAEAGTNANCAVDFLTPSVQAATAGDNIDDASMLVTIPLKLKSKTFAGSAGAANGLTITNGVIVDTTTTETLN